MSTETVVDTPLRSTPLTPILYGIPKDRIGVVIERYMFELQVLREQGHQGARWALEAIEAYDQHMTTALSQLEVAKQVSCKATEKPKGTRK